MFISQNLWTNFCSQAGRPNSWRPSSKYPFAINARDIKILPVLRHLICTYVEIKDGVCYGYLVFSRCLFRFVFTENLLVLDNKMTNQQQMYTCQNI